MKIAIPYSCDVCGAIKKESNKWWRLIILSDAYTVFPWKELINPNSFYKEVKDICSEGCLVKAESEIRAKILKENG